MGAVSGTALVVALRQNRDHASPSHGGGRLLDPHPAVRRDRRGNADCRLRGRLRGRAGRARRSGIRRSARRRRRGGGCDSPPPDRRRSPYCVRKESGAAPAAVRVGRRHAAAGGCGPAMANLMASVMMEEAEETRTRTEVRALDLSILIVTWNSERWIDRCLQSIPAGCEGLEYEVVIHDNSVDNAGFAGGTNRAFQQTKGRYVFLLNPDCELASRALTAL